MKLENITYLYISTCVTSLPWAAQAQKAVTASQSAADENQPAVVAPADTTFSAKDSLRSSTVCSRLLPRSPSATGPHGVLTPNVPCGLPSCLPGAGQIIQPQILETTYYIWWFRRLCLCHAPGTTRCITTTHRPIWTSWTMTPTPTATTSSCT